MYQRNIAALGSPGRISPRVNKFRSSSVQKGAANRTRAGVEAEGRTERKDPLSRPRGQKRLSTVDPLGRAVPRNFRRTRAHAGHACLHSTRVLYLLIFALCNGRCSRDQTLAAGSDNFYSEVIFARESPGYFEIFIRAGKLNDSVVPDQRSEDLCASF